MYVYCFIFLNCFLTVFSTEIILNLPEDIKKGESHYKELIEKVSPYGTCWKKALSDLHLGCKHLTEELQSRLALSFTNCFLKHSLSEECPCSNEIPMSSCLKPCSPQVFSTYTEFFTHTQSICHYLQHKEWQEQTERTVLLLNENAEIVSKKLDESSQSQSKIIDLQRLSLRDQRRIISAGRTLNAELQKSRNHAKNVFEDFKSTTSEQRLLIFEVFDRIKSLQSFVLGEFTSIFTFAYYIVGVIVSYILTSVPRTANARIWLLLIISANAVVERALASYSIDEEILKLSPLDVNGPIFTRIWMCRKIATFFAFFVLLYFYYVYEDYNIINNKLLKEIQQQNLDFQQFIQNMKLGEFTSTPVNPAVPSDLKQNIKNLMKSMSIENNLDFSYENQNSTPRFMKKRKGNIKLTTAEKSNYSKCNATPKKGILKENVNLNETESSEKRYNLRSRVNSPSQSFCSSTSIIV